MAGPEITIELSTDTWSVRAQGAVVGETSQALLLTEGDYDPVVYVPKSDLQMVFFDTSDKTTTCPHKGNATYYHLIGKSRRQENVAWSYEDPKKSVAQIKGYLAFDPSEVTVEAL